MQIRQLQQECKHMEAELAAASLAMPPQQQLSGTAPSSHAHPAASSVQSKPLWTDVRDRT